MNRPPVVIISCMVLQDILTDLLPEGLAQRVTYMDYGLHLLPRRMTTTLQETVEHRGTKPGGAGLRAVR